MVMNYVYDASFPAFLDVWETNEKSSEYIITYGIDNLCLAYCNTNSEMLMLRDVYKRIGIDITIYIWNGSGYMPIKLD